MDNTFSRKDLIELIGKNIVSYSVDVKLSKDNDGNNILVLTVPVDGYLYKPICDGVLEKYLSEATKDDKED